MGGASACREHHHHHHWAEHGHYHSHLSGGDSAGTHLGKQSVAPQSAAGAAPGNSGSYQAMSTAAITGLVESLNPNKPAEPQAPQEFHVASIPKGNTTINEGDKTAKKIAEAIGRAGFATTAEMQAAVNQDIADCSGAVSSASQCCGDPMSCRGQMNASDARSLDAATALLSSGPTRGGLKDYCGQMKTLSGDSRNLNSGMAGVCFEAHDSCESMCEDLVKEYSDRLAQCNGCETQSIYESAISRMQEGQKTCSGLGSRADQLANNGFGAQADQVMATHCADVSTAQTSAPPAVTPPASGDTHPLAQTTIDSNNAKAETVTPDAPLTQKPRMDLRVDSAQGFKGYKSGPGVGTQNPDGTFESRGSLGAKPAADKGIAPASASSAKGEADKNSKTDDKSKVTANAKPTDGKGRDPASSPVVPISGSGSQFENGKDLGQYLNSGVRSAMIRLPHSREINEKEENLFWRITAKMKEKCQMGILWECE